MSTLPPPIPPVCLDAVARVLAWEPALQNVPTAVLELMAVKVIRAYDRARVAVAVHEVARQYAQLSEEQAEQRKRDGEMEKGDLWP